MSKSQLLAARVSLAFLWIFTGITSLFFAKDVGYEVLAKAGVSGSLADQAILLGSLLDMVVGVWMLWGWSLRLCCIVQLIVIAVYTMLLSVIDPSFFFHPFGPVTKNIPLVVFIYVIYKNKNHK